MKIEVRKNKVSPPFKKCEFDILFGHGVNKAGELIDAAIMLNLDGEWRGWSCAADELRPGHPLGQPEILVKKLDPKELFDD